METILNRIEKIAKNEGVKITFLERVIGASKGVLSRAIANGTDIQAKWLQAVVENYPVYSAEWLLTGNGPMLKSETPANVGVENNFKLRTDRTVESQLVPLYELEAAAGMVSLFDSANNKIIDYIRIPDLPPVDGAVHVRGDSMYPILKSGDIVLYKRVQDMEYGIIWGEIYMVSFVTDGEEYIVLKYVQKSEREGHIRLVSHNGHHAAMEIPLARVRAMAIIKASVRYNMMG